MNRRLITVLVATLGLLAQLSGAPANATHSFGSGPYAAIVNAANNASGIQRCYAHPNKIAAMALAMTWHETANGALDRVPAPLNVSRHDVQTVLRLAETYKRAFWHPGTGYAHIDDANEVGSQMGYERFEGAGYARNHVKLIMRQYCRHGTTKYVFDPWTACGRYGATCFAVYQDIYDPVNQVIRHVSRSYVMDLNGGGIPRYCSLPSSPYAYFPCMYVNTAVAQGYRDYFRLYPDGHFDRFGNPDWSPLTKPFYIWGSRDPATGIRYENRTWLSESTGYTRHITARRRYGRDSRDGLTWSRAKVCIRTRDPETLQYYPACPA